MAYIFFFFFFSLLFFFSLAQMDGAIEEYTEALEALEKQRESLELVMLKMGEEWEERYECNDVDIFTFKKKWSRHWLDEGRKRFVSKVTFTFKL